MRHRISRLQFNRFTSWRKATIASLTRSLLQYESIKTTSVKAKAVRPVAEKLIGLAKEDTLAARRRAFKIISNHKLVSLLFSDIGKRFANRTGGYVRIINLGRRRGDNAEIVILELTEIRRKDFKKLKKEKAAKEEGRTEEPKAKLSTEEKAEEKKAKPEVKVMERPGSAKKPSKKFLGGIRGIFKKERDSL